MPYWHSPLIPHFPLSQDKNDNGGSACIIVDKRLGWTANPLIYGKRLRPAASAAAVAMAAEASCCHPPPRRPVVLLVIVFVGFILIIDGASFAVGIITLLSLSVVALCSPLVLFWAGNSCLTGIYFRGSKTEKNRIPKDFFFPLCFQEEFFNGTWFWRGRRNSCFWMLSKDFFARILAGEEFLYLLRIPMDSSGFLFPPKAVWLRPVTKSNQRRLFVNSLTPISLSGKRVGDSPSI